MGVTYVVVIPTQGCCNAATYNHAMPKLSDTRRSWVYACRSASSRLRREHLKEGAAQRKRGDGGMIPTVNCFSEYSKCFLPKTCC
jgi:hypothetical protein